MNQGIHLLLAGNPAGAEADGCMALIHPSLVGVAVLILPRLQQTIRQDGEYLVSGVFHQEGVTLPGTGAANLVRQPVRMGSQLKIQAVP